MLHRRTVQSLVAVFALVAMLCQGTSVLAGTTGTLTGTVTNTTDNRPLAGAKVTAASPSQTLTATTDAGGHFTLLSLAPDTYTVSVDASGFQPTAEAGVSVNADQTRVVSLTAVKSLRTIARVASRASTSLVKPGTTADVYAVNPTQQAKLAAAGGGGTLDSAFSALSTVPGVAVAPGASGYIGATPALSIRGGNYNEIGYQFDGIPINRSFDNYPSGATSSLGQQELQVYTGAPPPSSPSEGLSGFINQVIKTGTIPGYTTVTGAIGSPYYHKFSFEDSGTTLNNRLSYYVGLGGYNQSQRYDDQYDGASLSTQNGYASGVPCGAPGTYSQAVAPSCYINGAYTPQGQLFLPATAFLQSQVADRDAVINLHYYLPHKDGSRDDIQVLYDNSALSTQVYSSANDLGGIGLAQAVNVAYNGAPAFLPNGKPNTFTYTDGYQLNLPTGGFLPANYHQYASIYSFPNAPAHTFDDQINPALRDGFNNNQVIAKLQYTKTLGPAAFFRVYGYSFYSDWLNTGPNSAFVPNGAISGDYELSSHARGGGFQFNDQLNPQNLLSIDADYTKATLVRDNNTEYINGLYGPDTANSRTAIGVLVDGNNPTNGVCYSPAGAAVNCLASPTGYNAYSAATAKSAGNPGGAQYATLQQAYNGTVAPITATTCGSGPCKYLVIGNGQYATYNNVTPQFFGASLNDQIRPNDKLSVNVGLRLDDYQYIGGNTSGGPARAFWYKAYNSEVCENPVNQSLATRPTFGAACPTGTSAVNFTNPSGNVTQTYPEFQPRLGFTYSITPQTVFRAAYGRYTEPPNSAFEQYDGLQSNAPALLYGTYGFQAYGYTTPNHPIPPAASNNYDFSIEQSLPDQLAVKISPFLRSTQNESEQFILNRATNFVSGLNVGNQTSRGIEFELDKGDFARDGLSAKLAFTYTNSYVKYNRLSNGSTVLAPVVNAINAYNSLTKAGGGAPCYTPAVDDAHGNQIGGGTPVAACAAGLVSNPYYNAPEQNADEFNSTNRYIPYSTIPAAITSADPFQIGYPYVASLTFNEKVKRFAITPIVQFFAGQRYGSPLATLGIDPTACTGVLAGTSATGDPRYNYGAAGGSPYDASTCGQLLGGIPNRQTGKFDGIGDFVEPSQLLMHLQLSYQVSKNFSLTANLSNLVNTCFGGSSVPWKVSGACSYGVVEGGLVGGVQNVGDSGTTGGIGNTYNPGNGIQPAARYAYGPGWLQQPFGVYVGANIGL